MVRWRGRKGGEMGMVGRARKGGKGEEKEEEGVERDWDDEE